MRRLRVTAVALCGLAAAAARAQEAVEAEPPDLDFLEYLGAWAEDDDEWLAIEEWRKDNGGQGEDGNEGSGGDDDDGKANGSDDDDAD
jgi:hypothetical protein